MKKKSCLAFILSASCLLGASGLSSCQKQVPATTNESSVSEVSLSLDQTSLSLEVGGTATLKAILTGSTDAITWLSKDPTIAAVKDGLVTALKEGSVIIKAIAGKKEALCQVTVRAKALEKLLSINLAEDSYTLYETQNSQVTATVLYGDEPVAAALTYTIANTAVATIDSTGLITGVKAGSTTLTVAASYEGKSDSISVSIEVLALAPEIQAKFSSRDVNIGTPLPLSFELTFAGKTVSGDFVYSYSFLAGHTGEAKIENGALVGVKSGEVELVVSTIYQEKTITKNFLFNIHKLCSISFVSQGVSLKSLSVLDGALLQASDLPAEPSLGGYLFKGWFDASGAELDLTHGVDGDQTYTASFDKVVYNSSEGAVSGSVHAFSEAADSTSVGFLAASGDYSSDGYNFGGVNGTPEGALRLNLDAKDKTSTDKWLFKKDGHFLTLPSINFAAAGIVETSVKSDVDGLSLSVNGTVLIPSTVADLAYKVLIDGLADTPKLVVNGKEVALPDAVVHGTEGLKFELNNLLNPSAGNAFYPYFTVRALTSHSLDYLSAYKAAVAAWPASVSGSDNDFAAVEKVLYLRSCLTSYELSQNALPSQVSAYQASYASTAKSIWTPSANSDGTSDMVSDGQWQSLNSKGELAIQLQNATKKTNKVFDYYIDLPVIDYSRFSSTSVIMKNALGADYKVKVSSGDTTFISGEAGSAGFAWAFVNVDKKSDGYYLSVGNTADAPSTYVSMKLTEDVVHGVNPVKLNFYMDVTNAAIAPADTWKYAAMSFTAITATLPF